MEARALTRHEKAFLKSLLSGVCAVAIFVFEMLWPIWL